MGRNETGKPMCSRYNLTAPPETVRQFFAASGEADFPPRYNIAPTQPVLIVREAIPGHRELRLVRWGLIPAWAKDPAQIKATLINARAEGAADKPSFRGPLRHRRCLVPATGYYEWTGRPGAKQPHLIRTRGGGLMGLAGIWEHWLGADGSELETVAILTTEAGGELRNIHDRMPLVLTPDAFAIWLDCRPGTAEHVLDMMGPADGDRFEAVSVSRKVNSVRAEGPDILTDDTQLLI